MVLCNLKKYYKEDGKKYNLFVISIFYYDKYVRLGKKGVYSNKSIEKQLIFIQNIRENVKKLYNGEIPKDWKLRIYYDVSLFNFKYENKLPWKDLFQDLIKLDKVQLIKYTCSKYFNKNNKTHVKLFGTLLRFYPYFHKEENVKSVHSIDADNIITKPWMDKLVEFINSNYQINVFCSKYEFPRYKNMNQNDGFDCYFRAGIFSSKVFFKEEQWENMFNEMDNNKSEFIEVYNRIIENINLIFPNEYKNKDNTFFEFGFDEIILNYFIKKYIRENKYTVKYVHYKPPINIFIDYLTVYFKYKDNQKYVNELFSQPEFKYNNVDEFYDDFHKSIKKKTFFKKLTLLKKYIFILKKMKLDPVLVKFIEKENKKSYYQYPYFSTYLQTKL